MALTGEKRIKFRKTFWKIFTGLAAVILIFFLISIGWIGYLPEIRELQNPINKSATEIYSSDAQLLEGTTKGATTGFRLITTR